MKTAVLISGQCRTLRTCLPSQHWQVYRHFGPDIHFFVSVADTPDCQAIDDLTARYGADQVHADVLPDPDLSQDPILHLPGFAAAYDQAPYGNAAPPHQLLLQAWYQRRVWRHFENATCRVRTVSGAPTPRAPFDLIVRMRGDNWFHSFEMPALPSDSTALTPWWGKFGGCNDRFALLGRSAAEAYFCAYDRIADLLALGCPFHPETLVAASLEHAGCNLETNLLAEFSTIRPEGDERPHRTPEIAPWDMAHCALRAA